MLKSYLQIAWRNIWRQKLYAFINIAGLAVGMAAAVLIVLWIQDELTYDRIYAKTDRLYQVYNQDVIDGRPWVWGTSPPPLAAALKQDYPEVEDAARYVPVSFLVAAGDKHLAVSGAFADPGFLSMFDLVLASGDRKTALGPASGIVITRTLAKKLFGTTDALGKTIQVDNKDYLTVTAVLEDIPTNSRFKEAGYLLPWSYLEALGGSSDSWNDNNYYTYVLLREGAQTSKVNEKIKQATAVRLKEVLRDASKRRIFLHSANRWHLYAKEENGQLVGGRVETVRTFALIAGFILLVACINFMNLSTARSERRAKEVGIRKVAGAKKSALIGQFLSESVLLAFLSGVIALLLVVLSLPVYNHLAGKALSIDLVHPYFWLAAFAFVLFTGILAGCYPAFFLSAFHPAKALKGAYTVTRFFISPRKALVVLQFTFATMLIISTLIIKYQIEHAQKRDQGYEASHLVSVPLNGELPKHYQALRQDLIQAGVATSLTRSLVPITHVGWGTWGLSWPGSTLRDKDVKFVRLSADRDFKKTMGVQLAAGRDIDVNRYPTDSTAVLLNEAAVKTMRLKEPIGTVLRYANRNWHVVGVVKDFIFDSPYNPVDPVIIDGPAGQFFWVNMRLNPGKATVENLKMAENLFKKYNPSYPFDYFFADQDYGRKFENEQRMGSLIGLFCGLAVFISCLGMFGLAAYSAGRRSKEIGVRKVLGASIVDVVALLSKDFIKLVVIAIVIASPPAWYGMNKWLQNYAYRVNIEWWIFVLAGSLAVVTALLTVSFQSIKAALINPVKSLRSE